MPTEVVDLQKVGKLPSITSFVHASSLDASTTNAGKKLTSKMSMRLKKMGDWVKYKTENGQIFYYNELNGEFQWDNPFENAPSSSSGGSSSEGKKASKKQKASTNGDTLSSGVEGSKQLRKAESGEWKPFRDPTSNKVTTIYDLLNNIFLIIYYYSNHIYIVYLRSSGSTSSLQ